MNRRSSFPALMVIASAVLWGMYGSFATVLMNMGLQRGALTLLRFLVTAASMGLLISVRDRALFRIKKKDLPLFLANGLLSLLFFFLCYTAAIRLTKVATAAALLYTAPAIVMVLSAALFGEKLTPVKVFGCFLAVAGCAFASGIAGDLFAAGAADVGAAGTIGEISASGAAGTISEIGAAGTIGEIGAAGAGSLSAIGLLCGLGAGFGYALYSIFSRMILDRGYSVYTNLFYSFSAGLLGQLALSARDGSAAQLAGDPPRLLLGVLMALLTGPLAYFLYTAGMKGMETSRAAQLAAIEPVTAAILGGFLLRQPLSGWEILGIGMVVASVFLSGLA